MVQNRPQSDPEEIEAIFDEIVVISDPALQHSTLSERCNGDLSIYAREQALLNAYSRSDFLESSAAELLAGSNPVLWTEKSFNINASDLDEFDVGAVTDSNTTPNSVPENAGNGEGEGEETGLLLAPRLSVANEQFGGNSVIAQQIFESSKTIQPRPDHRMFDVRLAQSMGSDPLSETRFIAYDRDLDEKVTIEQRARLLTLDEYFAEWGPDLL